MSATLTTGPRPGSAGIPAGEFASIAPARMPALPKSRIRPWLFLFLLLLLTDRKSVV